MTKLIEFNEYCNVAEQIDIIGRLEKQMEKKYEFNSTNFKNLNCILEDTLVEIRTNINKFLLENQASVNRSELKEAKSLIEGFVGKR